MSDENKDQPGPDTATLSIAKLLNENVLAPMKQNFVGKDEVIDLLGVCLVARENLFILGPVSYTHLTLPTTPYV